MRASRQPANVWCISLLEATAEVAVAAVVAAAVVAAEVAVAAAAAAVALQPVVLFLAMVLILAAVLVAPPAVLESEGISLILVCSHETAASQVYRGVLDLLIV